MKKMIIAAAVGIALIACKQEEKKVDTASAKVIEVTTNAEQDAYASYGAKINTDNAMPAKAIAEKYAALKPGDTAVVKFEAPINSVCAKKGCWMRLGVAEQEEVFVKFKDYGFFVPLDAKGDAVVEGKAYLQEVSVDELKHMAEDAGKTEEEIAAITAPKQEFRFMADGVVIKSK